MVYGDPQKSPDRGLSMAEQPNTTMATTRVEFDFESYVYLADKGPMTACGLVGDDPDKVWFHTL